MKLLIADDDEQIRSGIEQGIDWSVLGIKEVITASNGLEALQRFAELLPEIVVTDVKMPGMDGLELLRQIKKIKPQTRVVILSGYNDFEYLKKAIQLDAVDYEIKPIRARSLIALIRKIKEDILREQVTEQEFDKYLESYKTNFLEELLSGRISDRLIILEGLQQYYGLDVTGALICVSVQIDYESKNKALSKLAADSVYSLFVSSDLTAQGICLRSKDGKLVLLLKTESISFLFSQHYVNELKNRLREWNREMNSVCQTTFSAGISSLGNASEFAKLYSEANKALSLRLYEGNRSIQVYDSSMVLNDRPIAGLLENEEFKMQLFRGDFDSLVKMIDIEFDTLKTDRKYSRKSVSAYCRNLLQMFMITVRTVPVEMMEYIQNELEMIEASSDGLLLDEFKEIVLNVFEKAGSRISKDVSPVMTRAYEFIRKKYTGELTVEMLSEHVGKSPNYFSHLFKRESGISFKEYVNRLRIAKAKELITGTNDLIYEISEKVGFSDYTYFTQVFKKMEGYPPAVLRKQHFEREER